MELTILSNKEYRNLADTNMLPDEAYAYLTESISLRLFSETIKDYAGDRDVRKILTEKLTQYDGGEKADSTARKVRDWLNDKYEPSDRETYFKICFALGLSEEKARSFLALTQDGGIHYRNPLELTYAFALRAGMDYPEARELYMSLPPIDPAACDEKVYTSEVVDEFEQVTDADGFREFYKANMKKFGTLHNRAYDCFTVFWDCLANPDGDISETAGAKPDRTFGTEEIMEQYLRMNVPSDTSTSGYTYVQKIIKKYWPNTAAINGMKNRIVDVNRKTLILLYLVTEGITPDDYGIAELNAELTPEERFRESYVKINVMLKDCGFSPLDPRNVFDWLVLYSVKTNNFEYMTDELQELLNRIFEIK